MKIFRSPFCIQIPSRPVSCTGQGCQIFSVAYGQNPDKKLPKWLFFENLMAKITKCFNYVNFCFHGVLKFFGRQYIFCRKNLVLPKKQVLTLNSNFCYELKTTCYNLFLFTLIKLRIIY